MNFKIGQRYRWKYEPYTIWSDLIVEITSLDLRFKIIKVIYTTYSTDLVGYTFERQYEALNVREHKWIYLKNQDSPIDK